MKFEQLLQSHRVRMAHRDRQATLDGHGRKAALQPTCQVAGASDAVAAEGRQKGAIAMSVKIGLLSHAPEFPEGGYLWVFLNWVLGFRALGCEVTWLMDVSTVPEDRRHACLPRFRERLDPYGIGECLRLCVFEEGATDKEINRPLENVTAMDLLLNVGLYTASAELIKRFRRSALLEIDPARTQVWISQGDVNVAPHTLYFTIGETVGQPGALFPSGGIRWHYTHPCVSFDFWQPQPTKNGAAFTTVSHWWKGWMMANGDSYENSKRVAFLPFLDLPKRSAYPLELALPLEDSEEETTMLRQHGWRVRNSEQVSSTPREYANYIGQSLGEFSCAKPHCIRLQNAWISDRTLCYLAAGKPAVVQHTGPSRFLPDGAGVFRFRDLPQAVSCLEKVMQDYENQSRLARALVEDRFDARKVAAQLLETALA